MGNIIFYVTDDGKTKINLYIENKTIWLSQLQIAELFQTTKQNVSKHIKNILKDDELDKKVVVNYRLITTSHGALQGKTQSKEVAHYNLDMILAIGYRVRSVRGAWFRNYASTILKEYLEKGFALNDEKLKNLGGSDYFKELLERIKDIRSSEKVMYRQVLDLYATAADYNPKADESTTFFKIVQNKLHYGAHGHTASEVVYFRVDSDKPFVGMTNFKGEEPTQADVLIAKNYLEENELKVLDNILSSAGRKLLDNAGKISHKQAVEKAKIEYKKYKVKMLSPIEKEYLKTINSLENQVKKKSRK